MPTQPIALITGGAQGIGYACAEALADTGAQIVLADIKEDGVKAAAEKLGNGALGLICDVADPAQVNTLFERIEADVGPVSMLVNNAGITLPGDFLETTVEQFKAVMDVNLVGAFCVLQRAAKTMVEKGINGVPTR